MLQLQLSSSDTIALASAVVSLCAMGIALWEAYLARRHSLLSVRPTIEFIIRVGRQSPQEISLRNVGLGPALLRGIRASIDGKDLALSSQTDLEELSFSLVDRQIACVRDYFVPVEGSAITVNESFQLLRISSESNPIGVWSEPLRLDHGSRQI